MTSLVSDVVRPRDTALLLGRLVRLREEWRLSPVDVQTLFGVSEASLVRLVSECGGGVADRIEDRVGRLDEIASLAWALAVLPDPAAWLRDPTTDRDGHAPLDVLARDADGAWALCRKLRADFDEARR